MKYAVFIFILVPALTLARSGGVGNGGDAVVCGDSVTLLDVYESVKLGLNINLENSNLDRQTLRSMVAVAVNRLAKKDKYTAKKLFSYASEMVSDFEQFKLFPSETGRYKGKVVYLGPDAVGEIADSKHRTLPKDCEIKQIVSQLNTTRRLESRYEIDKTIWDKLSLQDQAMTILHEAWYRIMIEDGAITSKGARYMNALIASNEFESQSFSDYITDLKSTEKRHYTIENNSTLIFDKTFNVDLKKDLELLGDKVCTRRLKVRTNIKKLFLFTELHFGIADIRFKNVCFDNSTIESLTLPKKYANYRLNFVMENYLLRTNGSTGKDAIIKFNSNGTLKEIQNMKYEALYKLFYTCEKDNKEFDTFKKQAGCEGPFLLHDFEYENPVKVEFDLFEVPIGYKFPNNF